MPINDAFGLSPVSIEFALADHPVTRFEINTEDTPVLIVAGKNGTGKTTLLHAINVISNLLSEERIRYFENEAVASDLLQKGINHLKIRYEYRSGSYWRGNIQGKEDLVLQKIISELGPDITFQYDEDDRFNLEIYQILEVSLFHNNDSNETPSINWKNGLRFESRIRPKPGASTWNIKWSETGELMYRKSAPIIFDDEFEYRPSQAFLDLFKNEQISKHPWINSVEIDWEKLYGRFISKYPPGAVLVDIDRSNENLAVEEIRGLLPQLNDIHRELISTPEKAGKFFKKYHSTNNLLPVLISVSGRRNQEFNFTVDYYEKTPDNRFKVDVQFGHPNLGDIAGVQVIDTFDDKESRDNAIIEAFSKYVSKWFSIDEKIHEYRQKWLEHNMQIVLNPDHLDWYERYHSGPYTATRILTWGDKIPIDLLGDPTLSPESDQFFVLPQFDGNNESNDKVKGPRLARSLQHPIFRLLYLSQRERESTRQVRASDAVIFSVLDRFFPVEVVEQPYLTSGQRQILGILHTVVNASEHSLILIDEPEISLHVDWQMSLIDALVDTCRIVHTSNFIIATTHSPDVCVNHLEYTQVLDTILDEKLEGGLT